MTCSPARATVTRFSTAHRNAYYMRRGNEVVRDTLRGDEKVVSPSHCRVVPRRSVRASG